VDIRDVRISPAESAFRVNTRFIEQKKEGKATARAVPQDVYEDLSIYTNDLSLDKYYDLLDAAQSFDNMVPFGEKPRVNRIKTYADTNTTGMGQTVEGELEPSNEGGGYATGRLENAGGSGPTRQGTRDPNEAIQEINQPLPTEKPFVSLVNDAVFLNTEKIKTSGYPKL